MQRVGTRSRYPLNGDDVTRYDHLCADAALDTLLHGRTAHCITTDPTGRDNLARAEYIRKRLRALRRRRELTPAVHEAILAKVVPELKAQIGAA